MKGFNYFVLENTAAQMRIHFKWPKCAIQMGKIKRLKTSFRSSLFTQKIAVGELFLPTVGTRHILGTVKKSICGRQHSKMQNFKNKKCNKLS